MARAQYSPEVRAACVAALLAGQGADEVAAQYNVPETTLRSWKSRELRAGITASPAVVEQRAAIGELLTAYLVELLRTLTAQLKVFGDVEWLKKQPAAEAGVLHGVLADKGIRLLEALQAGAEADAEAEAGVVELEPVAGALPGSVGVGV